MVHLSFNAAKMKAKKGGKTTSDKSAKEEFPENTTTTATKGKKTKKVPVGKGTKTPGSNATAIEAEEVEKAKNEDPAEGVKEPLPKGRLAVARMYVYRMFRVIVIMSVRKHDHHVREA